MPNHNGPHVTEIRCDVAVVGAGIAGLWCARLARNRGLSTVLLAPTIGGDQTLAAQGIIHSGAKYAQPSEIAALAEMPTRWRELLAGRGAIDLSEVPVSAPSMTAVALPHGTTTNTAEPVIDTLALAATLYRPLSTTAIAATVRAANIVTGPEGIDSLRLPRVHLKAQHFLFCAGAGNAALGAALGADLPTVLRPLRQVVARCRGSREPLSSHIFDGGDEPALTVTTHRFGTATYFYFGGRIATRENYRDLPQTRAAIARLLPQLDIANLEWATIERDRAELDDNGRRDLDAQTRTIQNATFCWPTKLCLAPRFEEKLRDSWPANPTELRGDFGPTSRPVLETTPIVSAFKHPATSHDR